MAIIGGLQVRPHNFLPATGTVQISIKANPVLVECPQVQDHNKNQNNVNSRGNLTSLVLNISSVQILRTGAFNLNQEWVNVTSRPISVDILQLQNASQVLGSSNVQEGKISLIRLNVANAAGQTNTGQTVQIFGSALDARPGTEVTSGLKTSIVVEPHLTCYGNGSLLLNSDLNSSVDQGPQ